MQAEMQRFLASAWEKRQPDLPIKTPQEAVVFASIVEKETGRADERDRVAGVFMNRMRKGMRLQSDPTVIYGIAGGQGTLGRSLDASRPRPEDDAQHLSNRRAAADADLQPGPLRHRGDAQSGDDGRPLFRRRRQGRPRVLRRRSKGTTRPSPIGARSSARCAPSRRPRPRPRPPPRRRCRCRSPEAPQPLARLRRPCPCPCASRSPEQSRGRRSAQAPPARAVLPCWAAACAARFPLAPGATPGVSRRGTWNIPMSIKSMTGFARAEGAAGSVAWHWELRSVNGRGLDVRLRLPQRHGSAWSPRCARRSAVISCAAA